MNDFMLVNRLDKQLYAKVSEDISAINVIMKSWEVYDYLTKKGWKSDDGMQDNWNNEASFITTYTKEFDCDVQSPLLDSPTEKITVTLTTVYTALDEQQNEQDDVDFYTNLSAIYLHYAW